MRRFTVCALAVFILPLRTPARAADTASSSKPSKAAPASMDDFVGTWQGRERCDNADYWVKLAVVKQEDGYYAKYMAKGRRTKGRPPSMFSGSARVTPHPEKRRHYKVRIKLPKRNIFRVETVPAGMWFKSKKNKDRVAGKLHLGPLDAVAGGHGHGDFQKKRTEVRYKLTTWTLKKTDTCLGTIKKIKKKKKKKRRRKSGGGTLDSG